MNAKFLELLKYIYPYKPCTMYRGDNKKLFRLVRIQCICLLFMLVFFIGALVFIAQGVLEHWFLYAIGHFILTMLVATLNNYRYYSGKFSDGRIYL